MSSNPAFARVVPPIPSSSASSVAPALPVVALCDPTPAATNAAWRAALVARELGTALRLLHVAPGLRAQASHQALTGFAARIRDVVNVPVESVVVRGDVVTQAVSHGEQAQLLVVPWQPRRNMRELIAGNEAERIVRRCASPVLVVKRSAIQGYRKVFIPLDLRSPAEPALRAVQSIAPDASMELFHAALERTGITMRASDLPDAVFQERQRNRLDDARHQLMDAYAGAGRGRRSAVATAAFGKAASLVPARANASGAGLVVIAGRRRGWLAQLLRESTSRRVIAEVRPDILVLDPGAN